MIKKLLDEQSGIKNTIDNLYSHPDPLQVVYDNINSKDIEFIALICALFAYGNAGAIVKFLKKLDFTLLNKSDEEIRQINHKYRFQNERDVAEIFISLKRFKEKSSIKDFSHKIYKTSKNNKILEVIQALIAEIYSLNDYRSDGYEFFFSKVNNTSAYKRYCMYYRWMVRNDNLDLGLFNEISPADLLMPLDTHTHKMGLMLGLIKRKQADQKCMLELSKALKNFCNEDPLKYDFALYRISQTNDENSLQELIKNARN
ncbi:TIGR02757 family protein [Campylobacter sp. RM12651]|uniref:TIGR02757 family protein n=2 Tax=unclassified Campylobacter TaxID=2593542 RepID=UPI001EFAA0DD|nr:TIGR02757 family protein [Campylobacter sp. RM12651]ULO03204.1 DUF2400 domain-containing protein [Campylobacter sp. RM12651]